MPIFSNAQTFTINNGQFTDNSTTYNLGGPSGIDTLLQASCPDAAYDAAGREYSPRCFPGTREQYIEDIVNWVIPTLGDNPTPIYWMKGPAGVGKSAIAQTCAEELKDRDKLGAAFFFSIGGRNKPEEFFPSIAYQLSTIHPPYRNLIDGKIRRDRTLAKKSMSFQFRYLIDEPLRELEAQGIGIGKRIVVIVDGLDECEGTDAQCEIIRIITSAASGGTLPLCWAFFSRPEPHIEATFAGTVAPHCYKVMLPISCDADGEIELYLRNGFENILKRRNTSTQSQWPSTEDMDTLVGAAGGSFIYATTVIRFVDHLGSLGPQKRLCAIIDVILGRRKHGPHAGTSPGAPFAELDAFYILIFQRIPMEIFPSVHLLLALISQSGYLGAILAANILGLSKDVFETVCNHASAVVHLQDPGKDLEIDPTIDTSFTYTQVNRDVLERLNQQVLCWISLAEFNANEFKLMVKRRKHANIIERYRPTWPSRIKSLIRTKTREHFESALYHMGHDEKSIFWYWEIDYELGRYRDFQAINLAEGEKRFREEDFDTWPEWGQELESVSESV